MGAAAVALRAIIQRTRLVPWSLRLSSFIFTNLLCSVFPILLFSFLAVSRHAHIPGLARYDLLFVLCVITQLVLFAIRWETVKELEMICAFHLLGLCLELFKVSHGSWAYPEHGLLKVGGVPLYSGFMYASVGSYICQAWRRFDLSLTRPPARWLSVLLGVAIYANFFTLYYLFDFRVFLMIAVLAVFWKTTVQFTVRDARLKMPMAQAFVLIAFFVWVAENICTRLGAWQYPYQREGWSLVHGSKIGSWFLLVIISFILVASLKARRQE